VTGLTAAQVTAQRGKAQISAPILGFDQETDIKITLTNLGLSIRPDLTDGHTVHWHGFRNAIPLFDGVPELSISVPIGRDFTYFYRPHDPGTYMYHCHFEDVEHVQMGMTGVVFVRPSQNAGTSSVPPGRYAYNDGDGSTRYDREFTYMIGEMWAEAHYRDAHIQTTDWTDYAPSFWTLNGRCYPDTLEPGGDPLSAAAGRLRYQPISSLVRANAGERVLLRLANLGYQNHAITGDGLDLQIVARDATLLRGRDGTPDYETTNTVDIGPGESRDVLFTAPTPGTYLLYDRDYASLNNAGGRGYGGQMTEIRVSAPGTLGPQQGPNS
jgi:FtsP/CotA-like multicopper oxidase with cupredoxin domain